MRAFFRKSKTYRFFAIIGALSLAAVTAALIAEAADSKGLYEIGVNSARVAIVLALVIVIYIAVKAAQSLSVRTSVSLQISNSGLVFSVLILLVAILSLSSGNNLLYLVLSVLLATMFVSLIGSRLSLSGVRVILRHPHHIFAGERVPFDVRLLNEKRFLPSFSIGVAATEESDQNSEEPALTELAYLPMIPAKSECHARLERVFSTRGVVPIKGFTLGTRFPLGFIEQRRFIEAESSLVVYPTPTPFEEIESLIQQSPGHVESRMKGAGSDLYAIRPYQSSDHHHHIDWKSTAKIGALMVREFTRDDDRRATILFRNQVPAAKLGDSKLTKQFETAVSISAGLLRYFIESGAEVRLLAGEEDSGFGTGDDHHFAMLGMLALIQPVELEDEGAAASSVDDDELERKLAIGGVKIVITPDGGEAGAASTQVIDYTAIGGDNS